MADAPVHNLLPLAIWQRKYRVIHDIYGFPNESWEARTTPTREAFWHFTHPADLAEWLHGKEDRR